MMKKVLITGGTGFIGVHVCEECESRGLDYLALCSRARPDNPHACQVSLQDPEGLRSVLESYRPDAIIHLAAIASPTHNDISEIYSINVGGTENLLKAASETLGEHTRVVLTSTAGVYGNQDVPFLYEDLPYNPANHYSFSKMITEYLSRQYRHALDIRIVRPFNVIGRGQKPNFFVPKIVNAYLARQPELQLGNLDSVRDYLDVAFCAKVMLDLATRDDIDCRVTNICSGKGYSCRQVLELLSELTGHRPHIASTADFIRTNEVWSLVGDTTNLTRLIGGRYRTKCLREIITDMLEA